MISQQEAHAGYFQNVSVHFIPIDSYTRSTYYYLYFLSMIAKM